MPRVEEVTRFSTILLVIQVNFFHLEDYVSSNLLDLLKKKEYYFFLYMSEEPKANISDSTCTPSILLQL